MAQKMVSLSNVEICTLTTRVKVRKFAQWKERERDAQAQWLTTQLKWKHISLVNVERNNYYRLPNLHQNTDSGGQLSI